MQNEHSTQKDLTLLRPFDLEKAMNGELLTDVFNETIYKYLGHSKREKTVVIQVISSVYDIVDTICNINEYELIKIKMNPLGWVENKPVYPEDVLYWNEKAASCPGSKFIAKRHSAYKEEFILGDSYCTGGVNMIGENYGLSTYKLTWNKPKVKKSKKIWINVYPYSEMSISGLWHSSITGAKESAVDGCIGQKELIVEWEE